MKNTFIIASAFLFSKVLLAQNKDTKNADKLFDRLEYINAAKAYIKLTENGKGESYVYKQIADSYYNIFNSKEAVFWYAKAIETNQDAETYFKYAQMLKAEGNVSLADQQMNQFAKMEPNDARAKAFKNNPEYLTQLKNQNKQFDIEKLNINTDKADFGAVLTNANEVYFTSARNTTRKNNGINEEPYLDLFKAVRKDNGTLSEAIAVEELNTKWHDGPATISADGSIIYYSSESFNEGDFKKNKAKLTKEGQVYLFKATKLENGKWLKYKVLPFNSTAYSIRNPSICKDGKTLYFSSNMPGGFGGEDIWKVSIEGETYGTPENLGANVNTEANESFPFIQDDNVLFFASNGRQGFGGFDIFKFESQKNENSKNLGEPINSNKDDFSFSYNLSKDVGYFASNRDGSDDLYQAKAVCNVNAIVQVLNSETNIPISDAKVFYTNPNGFQKAIQTTNQNGVSIFGTPCDETASFISAYQGFENGSALMTKTLNGNKNIVIYMLPIQPIITETEVILQPIYFEYNKSNITAQGANELDKLVVIMNKYPNMIINAKSHTDSRGTNNYNLHLSERRAKATIQYIISKGISSDRISGNGIGETNLKVSCREKDCSEEQHKQNRRCEFLIIKK